MKTVWGGNTPKWLTKFLSEEDQKMDAKLLKYEIAVTKAHAKVLRDLGVLDDSELANVLGTLDDLETDKIDAEDVHSYVELKLTEKLGDTGKKIHILRSRNDAIAMDMRLYMLEAIEEVGTLLNKLIATCNKCKKKLEAIPVPGFTHLQPAMPFTAGGYLGAFAESLEDDLVLFTSLKKLLSKSCLGSGAGFGLPVRINKEAYSKLLGLQGHIKNPLYAVLSRPKMERLYLSWLETIAKSIESFCSTAIFLIHEGIFKLPDYLTTGSSIMPQKKNPDIFEVMRGRSKRIGAYARFVSSIDTNLGVGYFRDFQETKFAVFEATETIMELLSVMTRVLPSLNANKKIIPGTEKTARAIELAMNGTPWRDAYISLKNDMTNEKL